MSKNLNVQTITKSQLRIALSENRFWKKQDVTPLSKEKAQWLLDNDRIEEDDFCMVLGFEEEKIIGFIYLMPDLLNTKDKPKKIYWMILWWVANAYKDTVFGTYLFNSTLQATKQKVLVKAYAENVNEFYKKQPFTPILERERHTIFFALDKTILQERFSFLKQCGSLINLGNYFISSFILYQNRNKVKRGTKTIEYEYLSELDNETWNFIAPLCKNDIILKNKEYISWQLSSKQYVQTPVFKNNINDGLITGSSKNHNGFSFKVMKENKIIGFVSFVLRGGEINIKYLMAEDTNLRTVINALMDNVVQLKANYLFTDNKNVAEYIKKNYAKVFVYKQNKTGLVHNSIVKEVDALELTQQDGHFI